MLDFHSVSIHSPRRRAAPEAFAMSGARTLQMCQSFEHGGGFE